MIESGVFKAVPFDPSDPSKLSYLLDRMVEHEQHWTDFQKDPTTRRILASQFLADSLAKPDTVAYEVWKLSETEGPQVVGILGFTNINPQTSAQFHPVFFDGKLRNAFGKRQLLLRALDWAFETYDLHRISIEVPEVFFALISFARKELGFRFEGEGRRIHQQVAKPHGHKTYRQWVPIVPSSREAEWGSRKFQALYKDGKWLDLMLLSVTREEFRSFVREAPCPVSSNVPLPSKPSPAISVDSDKPSFKPSSVEVPVRGPRPLSTDLRFVAEPPVAHPAPLLAGRAVSSATSLA